MNYNYYDEMEQDIREYLVNTEERDFDTLYEQLWIEDSVTGNASGSYIFSTDKAEENLCHNLDLLQAALDEFGGDLSEALKKGAEYCDVTIRCYLLRRNIGKSIERIERGGLIWII